MPFTFNIKFGLQHRYLPKYFSKLLERLSLKICLDWLSIAPFSRSSLYVKMKINEHKTLFKKIIIKPSSYKPRHLKSPYLSVHNYFFFFQLRYSEFMTQNGLKVLYEKPIFFQNYYR